MTSAALVPDAQAIAVGLADVAAGGAVLSEFRGIAAWLLRLTRVAADADARRIAWPDRPWL